MVEGGTLVLHNGSYMGPKDSTNRSRSFIGTTKDEKLVVATVDKHNASSVGVTLEEGANLLTSLGAINGFENLSNQGSVDVRLMAIILTKVMKRLVFMKNTYNQVMSCIQFCLKKS